MRRSTCLPVSTGIARDNALAEQSLSSPGYWRKLTSQGLVDQSLVGEFLRTTEARPWRPLGEVLLREGCLSMKQVYTLVGMQADEPDVLFGELAVREGLCSKEDVEFALRLQSQSTRNSGGEILVGKDDAETASSLG